MSVIASDSKILLAAEATGYSTAHLALPTAPSGTDALVVYLRAWFDNYTAEADGYNAITGWDTTDCWGLSFNGTFPARDETTALAGKTGFCGPCQVTTAAQHRLRYVATPGASWPGPVVELAEGQYLAGAATAPNAALTGTTAEQCRLPVGAVQGALFTAVWLFRRAPGQALSCSFGRNFEGLAAAEISKALTSAATVWDARDVVSTETTNWRTAEGTFACPTHFLAKFTSGVAGLRLAIDHLKLEFWRFNA